ncbi:MAG: hypothetical protein HYZ00_11325 [Candidatus Hydrogenedentes bacterium]|nr:hypothetical protein [Candidatus Hydrogenedentota bacterium]
MTEPMTGIEKLLTHVLALPVNDLAQVRLEDITLCAAWYYSQQQDAEIVAKYQGLRQHLDLWVTHVAPSPIKTEGHRQQPLLRALIREAIQGRIEEMAREEADFLYFAYDLALRSGREDIFERPLSCLKPFLRELERRRETVALAPGLPAITARITFCFTDELQRAEQRDVKIFAGINVPVRGPVLMLRGDVKLMGNIPAECALVVEAGSCYVSGTVLGKLAATNSCDVFDNVSGVIVARRGNVCTRNLLNQATAISKEGNVLCYGAETPRLVFACNDIEVTTSVIGGRFLCRRMKVGEDVDGGTIQATEKVEAHCFRQSPNRPLYIVLRRGLTCQDYGEVLTQEAAKMLSNAIKLRQRITNLEDLLQITERESDQYAGNILLYLLGEEAGLEDRLQQIQQMRRRVAFYERLRAGVRAITLAAEDRLAPEQPDEEATEEMDVAAGEEATPLEQLRRELMLLAAEGAIDRDLHELREEVLSSGRRLQRRGMSREGVLQVMTRLLAKDEEISGKADALERQASAMEAVLEHSIERAAIIERAKAECARVEVLDQLLLAARKRRGKEALLRRANERSIKLVRRNIENRVSRSAEYHATINDFQGRIRKIREKLWEIHQVSLPNTVLEGLATAGATVTGRFDAGVWVCAWQHLIEYGRANDKGMIVSINTGDEVVSYTRTEKGTIEAT